MVLTRHDGWKLAFTLDWIFSVAYRCRHGTTAQIRKARSPRNAVPPVDARVAPTGSAQAGRIGRGHRPGGRACLHGINKAVTVLSHRIRLSPNNVQASWFERCAGTARFAYNLGLARWQEMYAAGEKPNWRTLNAELNARKAADFPWMAEVPWAVTNKALSDLGSAFSHFFRRVKNGAGKVGYPKFKAKKRSTPAFAIEGRALAFSGRKMKVPKLGWVRLTQPLRFPGKVLSARFSKRAGHWYVSIQVDVDESWVYPHRCETQAAVGIDLGLKDLAVLSTGEKIEAPRVLRAHERRLRKLNKELSRRTKGGGNWRKTKAKLGRLHERIANVRKAVTHKLTADVVRRFGVIGIEDLNVKGMARGLRLAKSVMDAGMAECRRQLEYKALLAGSEVVVVDRWFPSTKTCSACGVVQGVVPLSVRQWTCECGAKHDRDVNAAINLRESALAQRVEACRPGSAGREKRPVKPLVGQEVGCCAVN